MKAGQFVSALRQVPKEYSTTLSSLQDQVGNQTHLIVSFHVIFVCSSLCAPLFLSIVCQANPYPFKDIREVIVKNLGKDLTQM